MPHRVALLAVVLVSLVPGCARYQYIQVTSNPSGAEIFLDGDSVGRTPMRLRIDRDDPHKIFLKKDGYRPELFVLELHRASDEIDFLTPPDIGARLAPLGDGPEQLRDLEIELLDPKPN